MEEETRDAQKVLETLEIYNKLAKDVSNHDTMLKVRKSFDCTVKFVGKIHI